MRTSLTDPLRIGRLRVGKGELGITLCPGKKTSSQSDPDKPWARDLDDDLDSIAFWGSRGVLTLLEDHEMISFGLARENELPLLAQEVLARKMAWLNVPIADKGVPGEIELSSIFHIAAAMESDIKAGAKILVHCNGGLGRAGMVAAIMLVAWGEAPARAIARVRDVRGPGAIETRAQEEMVFAAAERLRS